MKYSHSDNEETFHGEFDSQPEALADALIEYEEAAVVYVGECHKRTIGHYLEQSDVENLLESLSERAGEDCGESAEGWLDNGAGTPSSTYAMWREARKEKLSQIMDGFKFVLEKWALDHGEQPKFWHVENVKTFHRDEV